MKTKSLISDALASLPDIERKKLLYAFEVGLTESVNLQDGTFLGVNVPSSPEVLILQSGGLWIIGRFK